MANRDPDNVSMIDGLTIKIVVIITLRYKPEIFLNPISITIYVTNDLSNSIYMLNGKKQTTINVRHTGLQLCVTIVNLPPYYT
jgi:hypothetical protein